MNDAHNQSRKYGSVTVDATGRTIELYHKVRLGETVTWLGRRIGSSVNDSYFIVGKQYEVCYIYESSGDIELQGDLPEITIRASDSEYGK